MKEDGNKDYSLRHCVIPECKCHSPSQTAEKCSDTARELGIACHDHIPESVWEKLDAFIRLYCDGSAPHLLDNDENDGERLRESIRSEIQKSYERGIEEEGINCHKCCEKAKAEGIEIGMKDNRKKGEAYRTGYQAGVEEGVRSSFEDMEVGDENWIRLKKEMIEQGRREERDRLAKAVGSLRQ